MHCCNPSTKKYDARKNSNGAWKIPLAVLLGTLGFITVLVYARGSGNAPPVPSGDAGGRIIIEPASQALGEVRMKDGLRTFTYVVKNAGTGTLTLFGGETSCMCTTAAFEKDGVKSPSFGMRAHGASAGNWKIAVLPGEEGKLVVVFDPNAHGPSGTGYISRVITLYTDDPTNTRSTVTFDGTVVR